MSENYGPMVSFEYAIRWVEEDAEPRSKAAGDLKDRVVARLRYERDQRIPVKPKALKGRYTTYTCGNCGFGITEIGHNFCPNCGRAIGWGSPRCLTE